MDQRIEFIADFQRHLVPVSELCERFGISRKTAYKWAARYQAHGLNGLSNRSRRPHTCPHETPAVIVQALLEARHRHPTWGAKKLLRILSRKHP
ncbi:MAG: helix-turn-helix domain-containing protein, partial [Gemmatimonadales bacterium]